MPVFFYILGTSRTVVAWICKSPGATSLASLNMGNLLSQRDKG